ncbi:methionine sulfoxide reductase [Methylobacterium tarhaniae]|uniref:Methionine sulfoxide reductase n=1 Tax=Methylobacterium tarhaniae TaxID=1187852 RepID=A0A0J6T875_9HYPH|nr:GIY-YIG nuclease family protein [Methylobacterium tarhaniae]KMO43595.1 methionine sulfoxide reductase [Methylobacterium tarhaniae]
MNWTVGQSLELYYVDGRPDGMVTAEMFNWTGHVLTAPRTQITTALGRPEAGYTGIYLLLGETDEGQPLAYIGEGEDIGSRIRSHDVRRDWWTTAVLVTAAANRLNKAHAKYLESRLIEVARRVGRTAMENGPQPARPSLSEADVAKMEAFLYNLLMVLPAVRVDLFVQSARPESKPKVTNALGNKPEAVRFTLDFKKHGIAATAFYLDGELVVESGSQARLRWTGQSSTSSYGKLHDELIRASVLVPDGERCVFAQNYAFKSPSAAAAVIKGRSSNGLTSWHLEGTDKTYKEWEAQQLGEASAAR